MNREIRNWYLQLAAPFIAIGMGLFWSIVFGFYFALALALAGFILVFSVGDGWPRWLRRRAGD